jgi:uncharacterized protein (TIGR02271 family)
MTDETIVAVYDTAAAADAAVRDLRAADVPADGISRHAASATRAETATGTETMMSVPAREPGFWASLLGAEPEHDASMLDRSIESGSAVVTVRVPEQHVSRVTDILERHNPVDLDDRASGYGVSGTTTGTRASAAPMPAAPAAAGGDTIQLAEETLSVGKRAVNRGTTRIRRYVLETPVEEQVTLRTETVSVDRRPVQDSRPVTDAAFTEKVVEMRETSEEAVVAKTARVREEVVLRKDATERVETVKDTVRREDIEVEPVSSTEQSTRATAVPPAMPNAAKV